MSTTTRVRQYKVYEAGAYIGRSESTEGPMDAMVAFAQDHKGTSIAPSVVDGCLVYDDPAVGRRIIRAYEI